MVSWLIIVFYTLNMCFITLIIWSSISRATLRMLYCLCITLMCGAIVDVMISFEII
jgi:hypothetical protein